MTVALPEKPDGNQYEDLVVACLRVQGYFVESRLTLRDGKKEVLELDVIATPCGSPGTSRSLYEAKSGSLTFEIVFKLFGQRSYLNIAQANVAFLKPTDPLHLPVYEQRASSMGVRVCQLDLDLTGLPSLAPPTNTLTTEQRVAAVHAAWYQQIARRVAFAAFVEHCGENRAEPHCERARNYSFNVHAAFFQPTPLARAEALYSAYLDSPKLSGEAVAATATALGRDLRKFWWDLYDLPEHLWIQSLMHLEWSARLAIVKNALDDIAERGAEPPPTTSLKVGSLSLEIPLHALPESFVEGLSVLRAHPHATRLAYLYQCVLDLFGGFIHEDDAEELALISHFTGVPATEIVGALETIDVFFASSGGSMLRRQTGGLLLMKMVPAYVRGGGCFMRSALLGVDAYQGRYANTGWLLTKWHNALYHSLVPSLGAP